jgi:Domain of unknown function (DUF4377)
VFVSFQGITDMPNDQAQAAFDSFVQLCAAVLASVLLAAILTGCDGGRTFDLYVADQKVTCDAGALITTCLQVRRDPNAAWETYYTPIDGFNFEPGYFYHLRVDEKRIENPPADGPSVRDRLIEVIDKQPAKH